MTNHLVSEDPLCKTTNVSFGMRSYSLKPIEVTTELEVEPSLSYSKGERCVVRTGDIVKCCGLGLGIRRLLSASHQ